MSKEYTIYHIAGIKCGATENLHRRNTQNKQKYGKDIIVEILETVFTIKMADERENYWNDYFGYPRGTAYSKVRRMGKKNSKKLVGNTNAAGHIGTNHYQMVGVNRQKVELLGIKD